VGSTTGWLVLLFTTCSSWSVQVQQGVVGRVTSVRQRLLLSTLSTLPTRPAGSAMSSRMFWLKSARSAPSGSKAMQKAAGVADGLAPLHDDGSCGLHSDAPDQTAPSISKAER
jgi:hypothetical protein